MKTIIFNKESLPIIMDVDNNDARVFNEDAQIIQRYSIEGIYVIPEDCELRYIDNNNNKIVKKANKNDVVLQFRSGFKNEIVLIKNDKFRENVIARIADREAQRAKDTVLCENETCDCGCFSL